eukprot:m.63980 g.63980  ORF g.63980 m.63980 type:complete len:772 (+) comp13472_c0_seq1:155-2470(+)
MTETLDKLKRFGLSDSKAVEVEKNKITCNALLQFLDKYGTEEMPTSHATLLFSLASALPKSKYMTEEYINVTFNAIKNNDITMKPQLDAALTFFRGCRGNLAGFNEACGVGVVVTQEDIQNAVAAVIEENKNEILAQRYRFPAGKLMTAMRERQPWADPKAVKDTLDAQIEALLGPKTEEDTKKPEKTKAAKKPADTNASEKKKKEDKKEDDEAMTFKGASARFHGVGENDKTDGYVVTPNTARLLAEHYARVKGVVHTRFPPEPNGILHIGHAKAINFNFSFAKERGGKCYLRYDDTNPDAEEEEFFHGILRDVRWLGHEPFKITHSSDYFQELYEAAVDLIRRGLAYVCHQQASELKGFEDRSMSPWRDRPIEESLQLFEDMKRGLIDEGKATLRMKHIMEDGKVDPVAYRIKFTPHHRSGDAWCIYPTYDFTHCLCDSIEDITHSLCTKEFQNRRPSYYWLCNSLDMYCPVQWEYGRLNMAYALVSKRKIGKLISAGLVRDWDDPRLFTLAALRRRGFPPEAINDFCNKVGVTESNSMVHPEMLEACVRDVLNRKARRVMAVLDPVKVTIEGGVELPSEVTVPNNPVDESMGTHAVPLCNVLYIDRDDFSENPPKGYKRWTPEQPVALKGAGFVLRATSVVRDDDGNVVEVKAVAEALTADNKPKGFIHWVSSASPDTEPRRAQVLVFHRLFKTENPQEGGNLMKNVNEHTLDVYDAIIDEGVNDLTPETVYQFERIGYFAVDKDTTSDQIIFNRTVALREDAGKKAF